MIGMALIIGSACAQSAMAEPAPKKNPIQHVIIIMQENRSFDTYFGTFPGANGIPRHTCVPLNPNDVKQGCVAPFHDKHDVNAGGPHGATGSQADADDGITTWKMDGFVHQQTVAYAADCSMVRVRRPKGCSVYAPGANRHDVMGYHTDSEIPNYWAYAKNFVLQDNMFEGVRGWSLVAHLDLVSEWAAVCSDPDDVSSCISSVAGQKTMGDKVVYPWVNLFQLLDLHGVSWKYYLASGTEPDCEDDEMTCEPQLQNNGVESLWNPAPGFAWVEAQGPGYLADHNPELDQFLVDIKNGTLPQVSWIVPTDVFSEHPVSRITTGMEYVTSLVNAVMQSPYWANTAIYVSWDDWGGFYDHVPPPDVDMNSSDTPVQGFGLRVPGLLISAYARAGLVDHSLLSTDSYATLIEDMFMDGARLDPVQLGQPDARPDIRDALTSTMLPNGKIKRIGKLMNEFDFTQAPLPPLVLSTHIPVGIAVSCGSPYNQDPGQCTTDTITIKWDAVSGPEVPGTYSYQVERNGMPVANCATTATSCIDTDAPSGVHYYTIYSIDPNGVRSPHSAAAEADAP
jgi:phospholipase C